MHKIDPTRTDLAREYRDKLPGPHSLELQKLLKLLRWDRFEARIIAVQPQPGGPYVLARCTGRKGTPLEVFEGAEFHGVEAAQWAVFRARWQQHTGQSLELDGDRPLPTGGVLHSGLTHRAILGYADTFSVEAGGSIAFKISAEGPYELSFERLICGDTANIGHKTEPLATPIDGWYPGRKQVIAVGSYIEIDASMPPAGGSFVFYAYVWATTPDLGRSQVLMGWPCCAMTVESQGIGLRVSGQMVVTGTPLLNRHWYLVCASYDAETGEAWVAQRPLLDYAVRADTGATCRHTMPASQPNWNGFRIAAGFGVAGAASEHFNGKIDRPAVCGQSLGRAALDAIMADASPPSDCALLANWDFSQEISTTRVVDCSGNGRHGHTVNLPTRAMKGWNWDGTEYNWAHRPEHYGAIHFHDDDLYDCGWETDFELVVPVDLRSGLYCAKLEREGEREYIPFVVRPPQGSARRAKLALILPTASYWAYSNTHHHLEWREGENVRGVFTTIDATTLYLHEHPELGCSLYDHHSDGSGVCISSRLRPILNMRPGERLWQLAADTHILDWLYQTGLDFDVITDDDLEEDGVELLNHYACVMTGTHPEYPSLKMLDAFTAFQRQGGRFIYLGGNGFYWRTTYHPELPGVIEVRRAEDGIRTWETEGGEYYHSFSGELGGMWRRMARAPQIVAGIGMSAQGFDRSTYFERTEAGHDPRAAFIFDGLEEDARIGDFGLIGGGAAGWEVDRADFRLGTPPHALVVAEALDFSSSYHSMKEELTHTHSAITGETSPFVRCDMVFYETENGGAVFSVGSIAWAGALSHAGYRNNVARLTENVVRRFIDPRLFE